MSPRDCTRRAASGGNAPIRMALGLGVDITLVFFWLNACLIVLNDTLFFVPALQIALEESSMNTIKRMVAATFGVVQFTP
jgi:hypothetical protein